MNALRYGIVGGGFMSAFQLRSLQQVRGVEVAGLVSRSAPEALAAEARRLGLGEARVFSSVREMIPHVDVLSLNSPNYTRLAIVEEIVEAVRAGASLKGILCEKPLARNLAEGRKILERIRQIDVPHIYLENQVHMKTVQAHRAQLTPVMEAMGPPMLVRSNEEHAGPHRSWFWDPTQQGGGVMSDMGCHCLAVGWYLLTPPGKPLRFLQPESVMADLSLLKWGLPSWKQKLRDDFGVDYDRTPAEDFATGMVSFRNPETGQLSKAQFTVSWMFDKQGLRLLFDGLGAGYAFEMNSLRSPLEVFIGDRAMTGMADMEMAVEKLQASRGLVPVQPNEADLYGYTDENVDAAQAIREGRPAMLDWDYGLEIVRLTMAAYLSAERGATVELTDPATCEELETYVPLIQQGRGGEVL